MTTTITIEMTCLACGRKLVKIAFANGSKFEDVMLVKCGNCNAITELSKENALNLFGDKIATDGQILQKPEPAFKQQITETERLKWFMDIFSSLAGPNNDSVLDGRLIAELVKTGRFTVEDARKEISRCNREGRIFERIPGFWGKA